MEAPSVRNTTGGQKMPLCLYRSMRGKLDLDLNLIVNPNNINNNHRVAYSRYITNDDAKHFLQCDNSILNDTMIGCFDRGALSVKNILGRMCHGTPHLSRTR